MGNVRVMVHPLTGAIISPTKSEGYSSIAFTQYFWKIKNGFLNLRKRVAFMTADTEELEMYVAELGIEANKDLPGRIFLKETSAPQYEGQQPKVNPKTGRAILVDGALVYNKFFWDPTGTIEDEVITGDVITEGEQIAPPKDEATTDSSRIGKMADDGIDDDAAAEKVAVKTTETVSA